MISFDATSSSGNVTAASVTLAHTVGTGYDSFLLVGIESQQNGAFATGVTYNGVAMTQYASYNPGGGSNLSLEIWGLDLPTIGTHNIVVTFAASHTIEVGGASFFGVDQTTPLYGSVNATASTSAISNTLITLNPNDYVFDIVWQGKNVTPGQTDVNWTNNVNAGNKQLQGQYQSTTTAGSYSNTWTGANGFAWYDIIIAIKASTAPIFFDTSVQNAGASWTHTCTNASILFVFVADDNAGVTGVQYAGVPMTLVDTNEMSLGFTAIFLYMLAHPASGANTVTVQGSLGNVAGISVSYGGTDSVLDSETKTSWANTGSPITASTTVVKANCWLLGFGNVNGAGGTALTSNRTGRQEIAIPGHSGQIRIEMNDSNGEVGTGSQSTIFSNSNNGNMGAIMVSIRILQPNSDNSLFFGY